MVGMLFMLLFWVLVVALLAGGAYYSSDSQNTKLPAELRFRALLAEGVGSVRFERVAAG